MLNVNAEIAKAVELLQTEVPKAALTPDAQKNWNLATGLQMYNLYPAALTILPVLTPLRNAIARGHGKGKQAEFKAITNVNAGGASFIVSEGYSGPSTSVSVEDVIAVYRSMALATQITFEQEWAGRGFVNSKAEAVANLLRAFMLQEELGILFAQNSNAAANQQAPGAVGQLPAPTLTVSNTGGTIGNASSATTVYVVVTPVTGMKFLNGSGEGIASSVGSATVASGTTTASISVQPPVLINQPVLSFNVYVGSAAAGPFYYAGSTNGAAITVTAIPTSGAQPPTTDNTASANAFNGYLAQVAGGAGSTVQRINSTLSLSALDSFLKVMWDNSKADPDALYVNSAESLKITNLTIGGGTPYFVTVDNQNGATANFRVARFTNPVTGTELPVRVHPNLPQGTLFAMSNRMPGWYVPSGISNVMEMDMVQDYTEIDYPPVYDPTNGNGDQWTVAVRSFGTFKLYMPLLQGLMMGITAG